MSAEPPTEEDVLAALILRALLVESRTPSAGHGYGWDPERAFPSGCIPEDAEQVMVAVCPRGRSLEELHGAIAASERRLEVEQAERAVLDAALAWDIEDTCDTRSDLLRAARWYRAALVLAAFP